jgi:predicted nucleic acid-binding Zn ribbon protein
LGENTVEPGGGIDGANAGGANDAAYQRELAELARIHGLRRKRVRLPSKIGDVVNDLIARRGYLQTKSAAALRVAWRQIVGENLASRTEVGKVKRNVLEVFVKTSVMLQELSFQKAKILEQLQAMECGRKIRDVRFRVG